MLCRFLTCCVHSYVIQYREYYIILSVGGKDFLCFRFATPTKVPFRLAVALSRLAWIALSQWIKD